MWNQFIFETSRGERKEIVSSMVYKGDGTDTGTAMAKTVRLTSPLSLSLFFLTQHMAKVGLPLAMVTRLVLKKQVPRTGVQIPTLPEVYEPVLEELSRDYGVTFITKENTLRMLSDTAGQ